MTLDADQEKAALKSRETGADEARSTAKRKSGSEITSVDEVILQHEYLSAKPYYAGIGAITQFRSSGLAPLFSMLALLRAILDTTTTCTIQQACAICFLSMFATLPFSDRPDCSPPPSQAMIQARSAFKVVVL